LHIEREKQERKGGEKPHQCQMLLHTPKQSIISCSRNSDAEADVHVLVSISSVLCVCVRKGGNPGSICLFIINTRRIFSRKSGEENETLPLIRPSSSVYTDHEPRLVRTLFASSAGLNIVQKRPHLIVCTHHRFHPRIPSSSSKIVF
jgi:hypothetical protein